MPCSGWHAEGSAQLRSDSGLSVTRALLRTLGTFGSFVGQKPWRGEPQASLLLIGCVSLDRGFFTVSSTINIYFSQFWTLGSPGSRGWLTWCLVRALFLACRWLPSCHVLTYGKELSHVSSDKGTNTIHESATLMT